jgi:hypothetical protein
MTYRLYYWFNGTPNCRPGGPWWCRNFSNVEGRDDFVLSTGLMFHKWATLDSDDPPCHDDMEIAPPQKAEQFHWVSGRIEPVGVPA